MNQPNQYSSETLTRAEFIINAARAYPQERVHVAIQRAWTRELERLESLFNYFERRVS